LPRPREHLPANLETLYREAYAQAQSAGDAAEQARLDFGFRRDQLYLEAILDVREALRSVTAPAAPDAAGKAEKSVMEQLTDLRGLARLPFGR
jgi:hypothetical protein